MGAPLFIFQPQTSHDPVTPHEELFIRLKYVYCFLKGRGPLKN